MGRFLNADAVEYLGETETLLSYNLFAYCENNPKTNSDPEGYLIWPGEIHNAVVLEIASIYGYHTEQRIDYVIGWGRADLISPKGEVWEVKREKKTSALTKKEVTKGAAQLKKYVQNKWHNFPNIKLQVGGAIPSGGFIYTSGNKRYMVVYNYERDGVILYDYEVIGSQSRVRVEITTAFGVVVIIVIIAAWALLASHGMVIIC